MNRSTYLISCDWGTSSFRLRLLGVREKVEVAAEVSSARGARTFAAARTDDFRHYLAAEVDQLFERAGFALEPWTIYLSGMVTASIGWKQLPYAVLPFPLDGSQVITTRDTLGRAYGAHDLVFVSGVRSLDDAMRGEETELMGIFSDPALREQNENVVALMPGTHSKAVEVRRGWITGFRTYLTGELFQVLREHSILKHSVASEPAAGDEADRFFDTAVQRGAADGLLRWLFTVRTNDLLHGVPEDLNASYLSGLLIGDELGSILRHYPAPTPILLCGTMGLQRLYRRSFDALGQAERVRAVPEQVTGIATALGHRVLHARKSDATRGQGIDG